ncbi:MAG: flagellar basal-body rod protein FlgF [Alphaproteobacteria bacterium]|nr:flagellar basal-body rod protein FlgF [Alphaproteobacteria bacterium]MBO4644366.1 flagellar basal-body rod protein FlgF [Alphaproteobacteria bacterium]
MENTLYIALSRQTGLWNQLDMVANNLANVNTTGYKGVQPHFTQYLSKSKNDEHLIDDRLAFVHDFGIVRDFTEGAFSATGNPFDLAIHGPSYLVVETPEGIRYTRNGQLKLNDEGMLVTASNYPVLDEHNQPIFIAPEETKFNVTRDGTISTENGPVATLQTVQFADQQRLRATHSGLYRNMDNNPMTVVRPNLEQGMIEKSNVNAVVEMSNMIKLQRAYENIQMMIDTEHSRRQNALQVYARAGG